MASSTQVVSFREPPRFFLRAWFDAFARRFPFVGLVVAILASNLAGTFFSFFYNTLMIIEQPSTTDSQRAAFWDVAGPLYNVIVYPVCIAIFLYVIWPLMRCLRMLRRGDAIDPAFLQFCQRRLINLPVVQLVVNSLGVAPGAVFFPWIVTTYGGTDEAGRIWGQFIVSFGIHMVFTTVQTFFILQAYLTGYLYPEFFKETRPDTVSGVISVPFTVRMLMMWAAVALMPLVALLAVALNFTSGNAEFAGFAIGLVMISSVTGGAIFWLVGRDLWRWVQLQTQATGEIAAGNFDIRIEHPRPDEWGRLTTRFNDMATALNRAWESHETLGQLVSPEVRDQILRRMHGFEVEVEEITVLFVDIRGFTTRCAGEPPARIGELLNRFLTLALRSIEEKGGYVNKFLGDGVMALYGATHRQHDHADLALASAREMVERLRALNTELAAQGHAPLVIGIGIHTGEALVGCFGAILRDEAGKTIMRREFTAIGETVNVCQRIEQLTKKCGGPILLSAGTHAVLQGDWPLDCLGPQDLPGVAAALVVFKVVDG